MRQTAGMPDKTVTMSVREFLRGGYKDPAITGPIIVVSGDKVAFTAFPGTSALKVDFKPVSIPTAPRGAGNGSTNGHGPSPKKAAPKAPRAPQPQAVLQAVETPAEQPRERPARRPAAARRRTPFPDLTKRA